MLKTPLEPRDMNRFPLCDRGEAAAIKIAAFADMDRESLRNTTTPLRNNYADS